MYSPRAVSRIPGIRTPPTVQRFGRSTICLPSFHDSKRFESHRPAAFAIAGMFERQHAVDRVGSGVDMADCHGVTAEALERLLPSAVGQQISRENDVVRVARAPPRAPRPARDRPRHGE